MTAIIPDMLQAKLTVDRRNGTVRVNIPASFFKQYCDNCKKQLNQDLLISTKLAAFFALPLNDRGLEVVCGKVKSGEKPYPILINFDKDIHFYK